MTGRISDERFTELSADYEAEQRELKERAAAIQAEPVSYTHLDVYKRQYITSSIAGRVIRNSFLIGQAHYFDG